MLQLTKQRHIYFILNRGMEEVFKQISINTEDVVISCLSPLKSAMAYGPPDMTELNFPATSAGLARNE